MKGGSSGGEKQECWGGFLGSIECGEFTHSLQALVWPFKWVCSLPTGLEGVLGFVKVLKALSIAHQKSAL